MLSIANILLIALAYLMGSISFAVLVSRFYGLPDPRTFGSLNPGATNMLRGGNKKAALLTLVGDVAKGMVALLIARLLVAEDAHQEGVLSLVATAAFLGHVFPVFFGFKGGKGVATAAGLMILLVPPVGMACLLTWLGVFFVTRVSSMSALSATLLGPILAFALLGPSPKFFAVLAMAIVLLVRHKSNIQKLLSGEEKPFKRPSK